MIELITGAPGHGKTAYTIWTVKAKAEREGRPVYYSGIRDLTLPWLEIEPEKWFEAPPNSIVVIDECQRVFRPRSWAGTVPEYVAQLETHRHQGLDLVLVTQHPMLVDSNVRRLVGNHKHVSRRFGLERASIFEYESCKDQPLQKIDSATARHEWRYPKEVYEWYKSAEVHTVKARIPAKFFIVVGALVLVTAAIGLFVNRWQARMKGDFGGEVKPAASPVSGPSSRTIDKETDPRKWFLEHSPRVPGLPSTAPVYDKVVAPTIAPEPVACVAASDRCSCYSQQGTHLDIPSGVCRQIVTNGYFNDHPRHESVETDSEQS